MINFIVECKVNNKKIINLTNSSIDKEKSFISLVSTLIFCSILLNYYLDNEIEQIIILYILILQLN